jgi:hypothetical protein
VGSATAVYWLQWAENSALATSIRQSLWLYPSLEIVHIIGIALLVGAAFMFDLRLLGFSKKLPIDDLGNHLLSWSQRGLWLIIPSGILLFITNAEALSNNPVFWFKMGLLVLGGINALLFHRFVLKSHQSWGQNVPAPPKAKAIACISILVWIAVITCGRLLAY